MLKSGQSEEIMLERVRRYLPKRLRELLLLEQAELAASSYTSEQHDKIRMFAVASDRRHAAAESLSDDDHLPSAALLDREAAKLAIAALLVAKGRDVDAKKLDGAQLGDDIEALIEAGELSEVPDFAAVRPDLSETDPLAFDALPIEDAAPRRARIGRLTESLRAQTDTRSVREIRTSRYVRLGVVAVAILAILVWGVVKIASPTNLALHKPVTLSSRWPNQPPGSGPEGLPPAGLTDGTKNGSFGMCTREEVGPWAVVDLGRVRPIGKIVVYNRDDCCQGHLPALLDLSSDGSNYEEVGRRAEVFTESKPWKLNLRRKSARYVRIRIEGPAPHVLSLSELEVYAP